MFNTGMFVLEVKKRPCLWNVKDSSHSDRQLKLRAWKQIAKVFNTCSDSYSHQNITVDVLQRKWKHLRDYYIREKKRTSKAIMENGSSSVGRKRNSPLLETLQFLDSNDTVEVIIEKGEAAEKFTLETNEEEERSLSENEVTNSSPSKIPRTRAEQTNPLSEDIEETADNKLLTSLLFIKNMNAIERFKIQKQFMDSALSEDYPRKRKISETEDMESKKAKKDVEIDVKRDEFSIYGEYVASKLRNIQNVHARHTAEFHINGILYKAEIGEYDNVAKNLNASNPTSSADSSNNEAIEFMRCGEEDSNNDIKNEDSD